MQISSSYSMNGVPYETGSVYFRPSTGICSTIHIGTLASNNVTAAQALVKARERNGRELQNGEKSLLLSL